MNPQQLLLALRRGSWAHWLGVAVAAAAIALAIALPIMRAREIHEIEAVVTESSSVLVDALHNPAIFTGQPEDARAHLASDARQLSALHDKLVLSNYRLSRRALEAALDYTDYTQRIGEKLVQVGSAHDAATTALAQYDQAVSALKSSNLSSRISAQQAVNEITPQARDATNLAHEECELLGTLTRQFGIAQTRALQQLGTLGPDVLAAVGSLKPALEAATERALTDERRFNPIAR